MPACPDCKSLCVAFVESVLTPGYFTLGGHEWMCPVAVKFQGYGKNRILQSWEHYVKSKEGDTK